MSKPYELAIVCGRFQPLHVGHVSIIRRALQLANTVGLYIGSCNNTGTKQNPFTFEERLRYITSVFHSEVSDKSLIIKPLNDREHPADDQSWGKYYLNCIHEDFGNPDLFVYGNDKVRNQWFTEEDLAGIDCLTINRDTIDISATDIRKNIDDYAYFKGWTPHELWQYYDEIKNKIKGVNK